MAYHQVHEQFWLGVDPGGKEAFGLCFLSKTGEADCYSVSCAQEALEFVNAEPLGVGIDSPMWWSAGPGGDRKADQWIRKTFKIPSGTVQASNSLRGAALVQGVLFADLLRKKWGDVSITEAHPKALKLALKIEFEDLFEKYQVKASPTNDHERDAIVAAITAREGFSGNWTRDLSKDRLVAEQDPMKYWLAPMYYFWPNTMLTGGDSMKAKSILPCEKYKKNNLN